MQFDNVLYICSVNAGMISQGSKWKLFTQCNSLELTAHQGIRLIFLGYLDRERTESMEH